MLIHIVRHCQVDANVEEVLPYTEAKPTKKGLEQIARIADYLSKFQIEDVYSSPYRRALMTAGQIAARHGLGIIVDERLKDIDYGRITGWSIPELKSNEAYTNVSPLTPDIQAPGGESYGQLMERVMGAADAIEMAGKDRVAVVGHLETNRVLLSYFTGIPVEDCLQMHQENTTIYTVDTRTKLNEIVSLPI